MKSRIPNKKTWQFDIGYNPAPDRDNIIVHYLIVELCCNEVKYYTQFEGSKRNPVHESFVKRFYNDCYEKFKKEWDSINREHKKERLNFMGRCR